MTPRALVLLLHGLAGFVALGAGLLAMIYRKKLKIHRPTGLIFTGLMSFVIASSILLAFKRHAPFFLGLSGFVGGMLGNGWLALKRKGSPLDRPGPAGHRAAAALHALTSLAWAAWGLKTAMPVAVGLGAVGAWSGGWQWRRLGRPPEFPLAWLRDHLAGYGGAFIASITAFAVNILPRWLPPGLGWRLVVWFTPGLIGIPWLVHVGNQLRPKAKPAPQSRPVALQPGV